MKKILATAATLLLAFGSVALSTNIATADDAVSETPAVVEAAAVVETPAVEPAATEPAPAEPAPAEEVAAEPAAIEQTAEVIETEPVVEPVVETVVSEEPDTSTGTDPPVETSARVATASIAADAYYGIIGTLYPNSSDSNKPPYWEDFGPHDDAICYKYDSEDNDFSNNGHATVINDGKTVILKPYGDDWPGDHWELLVVKAGTQDAVTIHPAEGQWYAAPDNKDISHYIVCKGTTPEVETPVASASVQTTPGTCEAAGTVVEASAVNATFGDPVYENGTYTIVATATGNAKFAPGDGVSDDGTTKTFTGQVPPQNTELCEGTVTYCHAMPADTAANGWQLMSDMPVQSVNGHKEHAADIIPPVPGILPQGLNWNESFMVNGVELTAQQILRLGCEFEIKVPGDPTSTDEYCVEDEPQDGSITVVFGDLGAKIEYRITGGDGVDIKIETGDPTTVYLPAGVYTVTAKAVAPYELTGEDEWVFTIASTVDCGDLPTHDLVEPTISFEQPTCFANGSFTVGGPDVQWSRNGVEIANGKYSLASGVEVELTVAPKPPHGFSNEQQTSWEVSFAAPSGACDLTTLALTGSDGDQSVPLAVAGFAVLLGLAAVFRGRRAKAVR